MARFWLISTILEFNKKPNGVENKNVTVMCTFYRLSSSQEYIYSIWSGGWISFHCAISSPLNIYIPLEFVQETVHYSEGPRLRISVIPNFRLISKSVKAMSVQGNWSQVCVGGKKETCSLILVWQPVDLGCFIFWRWTHKKRGRRANCVF